MCCFFLLLVLGCKIITCHDVNICMNMAERRKRSEEDWVGTSRGELLLLLLENLWENINHKTILTTKHLCCLLTHSTSAGTDSGWQCSNVQYEQIKHMQTSFPLQHGRWRENSTHINHSIDKSNLRLFKTFLRPLWMHFKIYFTSILARKHSGYEGKSELQNYLQSEWIDSLKHIPASRISSLFQEAQHCPWLHVLHQMCLCSNKF